MLMDSAFLQEKDADFCNRRREYRKSIGRDDSECDPLYTAENAETVLKQFENVPMGASREIFPGVLNVIPAHMRRHLWQARKVAAAAGFPRTPRPAGVVSTR